MIQLTKAEEQVMQYLWNINKGFVKDIVDQFPDPKPAYTTITTIIRVMVKKGFIGFSTYGKIHEYYPLFSRNEYMKSHFKNIMKNYFNNSYKRFVSFFTNENDMTISEMEEMKILLEQQIKQRKINRND